MIAAPEQISTGNVLDYLATRGISLSVLCCLCVLVYDSTEA